MSVLKTYGLKKYGECPSLRQMEWYRRERTAFFHFGMNTFTDKEWGDGTESPTDFNPTSLDCRQWIKCIKAAGFTTAIITAKHHDGFCLWQSKFTEHGIKNSPYKNGNGDIVREFTDACREFGIKAGIYLSPWDRYEKTWGTAAYNDFYANQLAELMTNYGKIWECWWDGAGSTETDYDWGRWANIVRSNQSDAVIFGSLGATPYVEVRWIGNENGIAGNPCFATVNAYALETEERIALNHGTPDGDRFIPGEADVSIRPGWFYHSEQNQFVKAPENLLELWLNSIGKNAGFLLNIPPDRHGLICEADVQSLKRFNELLTSATKINLALCAATVSASSVRNAECSPDMMLLEDENVFYAPSDDCRTPVIELDFKSPVTFNAFKISELIELGHKIRRFKVSGLVDGVWKALAECECMGYRWIEHFETVTASRVKIEITAAVDVPAIRSFAMYRFDEALFRKSEASLANTNILDSKAARIETKNDEIFVNLGGVFPYNTIVFDGRGAKGYELYVFNGASYELKKSGTAEAESVVCSFDTVTDSYGFKLKLHENSENIDRNVEVFCK